MATRPEDAPAPLVPAPVVPAPVAPAPAPEQIPVAPPPAPVEESPAPEAPTPEAVAPAVEEEAPATGAVAAEEGRAEAVAEAGETPRNYFVDPAVLPSFSRDTVFNRGSELGHNDPFDSAPPFRPRRNPARFWTVAAVLFFLLIAAAGAALYRYGPPDWAVRAGLVADNSEPELLFYLSKPAERRKLPNGQEFFAFSARIVNSGTQTATVPPVVVELRDRQNRLVFSWTTRADKGELKPGEEASINESRLDIPRNAENLSLSFLNHGN